ncbi:hypothetical protein ACLMJK_001523 [Lecanora helva]
MPSPPRPLRGSPPRRALHERTESQTNERSLRMIGDPQAPVYGSPFPTKPSQILSPPKGQDVVGAESDFLHGSNSPRGSEVHSQVLPKSTTSSKDNRSSIGNISEVSPSNDTAFYTPPMDRPGPATISNVLATDQPAQATGDAGRMSDDIVQLPNVPLQRNSPEACAAESPNSLVRQPVQTKDSESSLSSSNSTGTVLVKKNRDGKKRASYSAFPNFTRPSSSRSNSSPYTPPKTFAPESSEQRVPPPPILTDSHIPPPSAGSAERRVSSVPVYTNLHTASNSSINLQYPVIRPPSASASWVEPPDSAINRPPQVTERSQERWNPHLSTVQSEGTGSQSEGRSSQTVWLPDSSRVSKSSSTAFNGLGSLDFPPTSGQPPPPRPRDTSDLSSPPRSPPVSRRDFTGSTIRVVTEQEDLVPKLQPIPGSRGSEYLGVPSASDANRNSVIARPSSRASFFRDSIPAWAKLYYSRPPPSASTDNVSLNIFRPRTRNNQDAGAHRRSSLEIAPVRPRELDLAEVRGPPRRKTSSNWSPHLWHDRTSLGRRRTIFKAPSVDEQAEGKAPNKRNAQILLFVIGFIFPLAWFLASFLPLPPRPNISSIKGKNIPRQAQAVEDLEKQLDPIDEARYENARWWRNINRIMSLVGVVIVVAVITIAAVTAT